MAGFVSVALVKQVSGAALSATTTCMCFASGESVDICVWCTCIWAAMLPFRSLSRVLYNELAAGRQEGHMPALEVHIFWRDVHDALTLEGSAVCSVFTANVRL